MLIKLLKRAALFFVSLLSNSQRKIDTGGGDYREVHNRGGYYAEGDINIVLQKIASSNRPKTEKILLQQVGAEIASRLRQSLHNQVFINLEKEDQAKQVKRPWDYEVKVGSHVNEKLSPDTTILEVFDRPNIQGRLLILGKPGSGKTTTMLDLARELLERSQNPNELIPILVNLSSWASSKQQSIPEWLVKELHSKYGVNPKIGKQWLQEQKLLPLLDGLDEVRSDRQIACVEALNQWIGGNAGDSSPGQFVVCSRIEEYEQLETQLQMNGAICLTELSNRQIQGYLESVGRSHLWSLVSQNQTLKDLVSAPLFLSMIVIADLAAPEELQNFQETGDAESLLLDIYIGEMLRRAKDYTPRQIRLWLVWLAKQMELEQRTEFLVEKIQPNWLRSKKLNRSYLLRFLLSESLIFGLSGWLTLGLFGLIFGLILGLWMTLREEHDSYILLTEDIYWSWKEVTIELSETLIFGLIGGLIFGLLFIITLPSQQSGGLSVKLIKLILWMISGLFVALVGSLIHGLKPRYSSYKIEQKISINQDVWKSLQLGLILLLIEGLFLVVWFLLMITMAATLTYGPSIGRVIRALIFGLDSALNFGLFFGVIQGMIGGLQSGIKHFILRQLLYANGFAPWNYARFLVSCSDCLLLQQVGGRFRFIHKTVQEHFAAMDFERP